MADFHTSYDAEAAANVYAAQMQELEMTLMLDIVEAIREAGEITAAADYRMERLFRLGVPKKQLRDAIQAALHVSDADMAALYEGAARAAYVRDAALYEAAGVPQIPLSENTVMQQRIKAQAVQTAGEMRNLGDSIGFISHDAGGNAIFSPVTDYYRKTVDKAIQALTTGAYDYNTVIGRAVREMTDSGLRTVDFESGATRRADGHIRTVVMTGASQITAKIAEQNMDALGTEYVEVDYHGGARPSHQVWQGKVFHWKGHGKSPSPSHAPENPAADGGNSPDMIDFSEGSGIIEETDMFHTKDDPMREVMGSAYEHNRDELFAIIDDLESRGFEVEISDSNQTMGYQPSLGSTKGPGKVKMNREASLSAWLHESQHAKDDEDCGWQGLKIMLQNPEERYQWEVRAYQKEIELAESLGYCDMANRLQDMLEEERRRIFDE